MRSKKVRKPGLTPLFVVFFAVLIIFFIAKLPFFSSPNNIIQTVIPALPSPTPLPPPPSSYVIPQKLHVYETFNNCGPASLSMLLSYFGITKTQAELGQKLRPFQHPKGDNDDKSVTLRELAREAGTHGLLAYHRPNGDSELLKQFIAHDIPVITRTWLKPDEDIGHYRVVRGYDDEKKTLIQDDSLQGNNLSYSYNDFDVLWKKFNYEYLVLVPKEKRKLAENILGANLDEKRSWQIAVTNTRDTLAKDPQDIYARFNLSVALYNTGNYQQSVAEFEKVEDDLPFRTLWYQTEPIHANVALKKYDRVFEITDKIIANGNRGFSELYLIRGNIYKAQGKKDLARQEFEKAVLYNKNLKSAREALEET